ncbi:MAG: NTP transferase domain-containing protein [Ilumatobacter sp.]
MSDARSFTTGLVLAAGRSSRLGQPKQLLEYRGRTLLDASLDVARRCDFDQRLVALGGAGDDVRAAVELDGFIAVDNVHYTSGCSSSIVAALDEVDPRADALVLMLGDQPGVSPDAVAALCDSCEHSPASIGVCRYDDGRGHPFWFASSTFDALRALQGDKAVWKLLESGAWPVVEVQVDGPVPLDVDTWDDYHALLGSDA